MMEVRVAGPTIAQMTYWLDALYCCQDAKRLEGLGDDWDFVSVQCTIEDEDGNKISSSSAYGVESDSEDAHFWELTRENLDQAISEAKDVLSAEYHARLDAFKSQIVSSGPISLSFDKTTIYEDVE